MPLQDNYNLVAATATLSPTALPRHTHTQTHTHTLLIGLRSQSGNYGAEFFLLAPTRLCWVTRPRELVRLEIDEEDLQSVIKWWPVILKNLMSEILMKACDLSKPPSSRCATNGTKKHPK